MLRIWLGAIKARTFQVKAETTSLTLSHPIVPGYCSCWKGKIRAVTVWRVNESWGTLKSRIIWLPHTMHCSHVLAILMQSLLGEGEKIYPSGCVCTLRGLGQKAERALFKLRQELWLGCGGCEEQQGPEPPTQSPEPGREPPAPSDSGEAAGESLTQLLFIQELCRRGSFWPKKFHFPDFIFLIIHGFKTPTSNFLKIKTAFCFQKEHIETLDTLRIWLNWIFCF